MTADRPPFQYIVLLLMAMVITTATLTGCASAPVAPSLIAAPVAKEAAPPDLSAMVVLIGRFGAGHACPVGPRTLYSAAHVTDERPFDRDSPLYALRMEQDGHEDVAQPVEVDTVSDAALLRPVRITLRYFPRAAEPPKVGERLWDVGYRWSSRHDFATARTVDAKVTRVVAGHVFLTESAGPGSSGSCWVNARGEAVAINVWGIDCGGPGEEPCAGAVGMWGRWRFSNEDEPQDPESVE